MRQTTGEKILNAMRKHPGEVWTVAEIGATIDKDPKLVSAALSELLKRESELHKERRGHYMLIPNTSPSHGDAPASSLGQEVPDDDADILQPTEIIDAPSVPTFERQLDIRAQLPTGLLVRDPEEGRMFFAQPITSDTELFKVLNGDPMNSTGITASE